MTRDIVERAAACQVVESVARVDVALEYACGSRRGMQDLVFSKGPA